ncbi:TPA: hypothetical protein N0F65_006233 [Lagenidium giganteum]|uniref:BZIP domain-containing protein n=1 Tax=Lagenidium giganteum TaxID=4803 RepID=A0AAV2Z6A4_9STRA|nr:TPA: hypothetical protein N0F65_006233 [Lagenidium giganteum]
MAEKVDCVHDSGGAWWSDVPLANQASPVTDPSAGGDALRAEDSMRLSRRRQQLIECARRNRSKKKRERDQLVEQVKQLSDHVEALRSVMQAPDSPGDQRASSGWQERTLFERRKLAQALNDNAALRDALFRLCGHVHELRSVFSSAPTIGQGFTLFEMLHSYTHLGRNSVERQRRLAQVCSATQLAMVEEVIRRETAQFDCRNPSITTTNWSTVDRFGSNHRGLFVVDGPDLPAVFNTMRQSVKMAALAWPHHHQSMCVLEPITSPDDELYYARATVHYRHEQAAPWGEDDAVVIVADAIYFSRLTPTYGFILIDYVDADDLLPMTDRSHLKRDHVGGILVRPETGSDGTQRIIVRYFSAKCHKRSQSNVSPSVQRFQETADDGRLGCTMSLVQQIQKSVESQVHS